VSCHIATVERVNAPWRLRGGIEIELVGCSISLILMLLDGHRAACLLQVGSRFSRVSRWLTVVPPHILLLQAACVEASAVPTTSHTEAHLDVDKMRPIGSE
jgi:hypothetical protein